MTRWFRMYAEVMDDPKVQRLPAEDFRGWVNLLCLCARHEGRLPSMEDVSFALRRSLDDASTLVERLRHAGLVDRCSGGADGGHDAMHGWKQRQYKSDTSTDRVKRFRQRTETATVTPPETETETDISSVAKATSLRAREAFPKPDFADAQHWRDFLENRKRKRLPNTASAYAKLLRDVEKFSDAEWPPGRLIEHAAGRGWAGIYDPREGNRNVGRQQQSTIRGTRPDPALDLYLSAQRELAAGGGDCFDDRGAWPALPPGESG